MYEDLDDHDPRERERADGRVAPPPPPRQPRTSAPQPPSVAQDLIAPRIISPKSINILAGASGVGKTALMADWMRRFRDAEPINGKVTSTPPGGMGIITTDRGGESHQYWFDKVGFPDVRHYSLCKDHNFTLENLNNRALLPQIFETALHKLDLAPGALVVVDPLAIFVAGNMIDYKSTAISLMAMGRICDRLDLTVIGVAHMAKQKGKDDQYTRPQDRILGSMAFAGYTDTMMYLIEDEDFGEGCYEFGWVPHTAPSETFTLTKVDGLFIPYEAPDTQSSQSYIFSIITEDTNGTQTKEIFHAVQNHLGISRATFNRYLAEMRNAGLIEGAGHGRWRRRPAGHA